MFFKPGKWLIIEVPIWEVIFIGKFKVNEKDIFKFKTNCHTSLEEDI